MEEIMKAYRTLPNRPTIEEVEDAKTLIQKVEAEAQSKVDAISRKKKSINMPDDMFNVLQEMRRNIVHFESKEKKRKAVRLLDLENAHQVSDELIYRASTCVASDLTYSESGSDGENVSHPVWIWGLVRELGHQTQLYCVDIMEEDVYSQKKFRLSLHSRDECRNIKRKHTWYDVDPDVTKLDRPKRKSGLRIHADSLAKGIRLSSICVALGSSIYFVGGDNDSTLGNTIHHLDTKALHLGWRTFSMKVGRVYPKVAVVDGKLYIVGGVVGPEGRVIDREGEIFDPQTGQSELMLDAPPEYVDSLHLITVLPEPKEILFLSKNPFHLLYYGVNTGKWRIDHDDKEDERNFIGLDNQSYRSANVMVGNIIYWFTYCDYRFTAYNFSTGKFYQSEHFWGKDFEKHGTPDLEGYMCFGALIHLRDDFFCVVWEDAMYEKCFCDAPNTCYKKLRCTKLQICIDDEDSGYLSASLLSTQTYFVEASLYIAGAVSVPSSNPSIGSTS